MEANLSSDPVADVPALFRFCLIGAIFIPALTTDSPATTYSAITLASGGKESSTRRAGRPATS
ncbi:hypothetical protein M3B92_01030 [Brevibacterium casei]|uniref:Uncharacterized protein n=1 Tax=Brevibacterium metallidurans TaxID=1482676 RepID=A0ABN0SIW3_9MICO|nr:hypothetical protein [Brevibacterium casei]MCT1764697.1 hypothetical protein [Brevibacterium casei]MCT2357971.1 hypothetical protein [Brevibacterium casei]